MYKTSFATLIFISCYYTYTHIFASSQLVHKQHGEHGHLPPYEGPLAPKVLLICCDLPLNEDTNLHFSYDGCKYRLKIPFMS